MNIKKILELHALWLESNGKEGECADFSGANLFGEDLSGVNLSRADLSYANLSYANFSGANLSYTILIGANLFGAKLNDAKLNDANLSGANLNFVKGKCIITFIDGQHQATFVDGFIRIGCEHHDVAYWKENYKEICKNDGYTEEQINSYGNWIVSLKQEN